MVHFLYVILSYCVFDLIFLSLSRNLQMLWLETVV